MAKPRYFFISGTRGKEEYYMLLRAGPRSLKELSGHYDFTPVMKPDYSRKYETLLRPSGGPRIRFKVGKNNRVSPSKKHSRGLEFKLKEIDKDEVRRAIRKLHHKRMLYDHYTNQTANI